MDLIGGLIWLIIILAFVVPWVRGAVQRLQGPAPVRPAAPNPRGLTESGGYQVREPAPVDQSLVRGPAQRASYRDAPDRERETTPDIREGRRGPSPGASGVEPARIRRQLQNPQAVRSAVVLRELLDPPVSMR